MKRTRLCIVLFLLLITGNLVFGQLGIRKGLKIGSNWSTFSGDSSGGISLLQSYIGGVNLEFLIDNQWAIQLEILYSPEGIASKDSGDLILNYLAIPILMKKQFLPYEVHLFFSAGIEFNYLLSAKRNGNSVKEKMSTQILSLIIGGGVEFILFNLSTYFEGRYLFGMDNVYKTEEPEFPNNFKNRIIQVSAGIFF
jgi:hypothetical protein